MTSAGTQTPRRLEFDVVLDTWPTGAQGTAFHSLVASGDIVATELPYGFVGLRIISSQTLLYVEEGRWHVAHVLPKPTPPRSTTPQYQYPLRPV